MKHRELDTVAKMQTQIGLQGVPISVKGKAASNLLRERGTMPKERNPTSVRMLELSLKPQKTNDRARDHRELALSQEVHNRLTESYNNVIVEHEANKVNEKKDNFELGPPSSDLQFSREMKVPV